MSFKNIVLLYLIIGFNFGVNSQPSIIFSKCYGGPGGDGPSSLIRTSDGGRLIVGTSGANGGDVSGWHYNSDSWVVKTDSLGAIQWQKCLGGSGNDVAIATVETTSGYVISNVGSSFDGDQTNNHGRHDYWIVKLDNSGNILWEYSYGGTEEESVYGMSAAPDGGFVLSGTEHSGNNGDVFGHHGIPNPLDIWLIKIDSLGILNWQKCLGGTDGEQYGEVVVDTIGNIYMVGVAGSTNGDVTCNINGKNCWLVKLDSAGNILWDKCFGGSNGQEIHSIQIKGNKLLMSGKSLSSNGDLTHNYGYIDAWILITDTSGNKILSQSYGGSQSDEMLDAKFINDNLIVAGGTSNSNDFDVTMNHSHGDCWLIVVDTLGNLIWQNTYGGSGQDIIESLLLLPNETIQFAALTNTLNDGDISGLHGSNDIWVVTLDFINEINKIDLNNNFKVYPQPFTNYFKIQFPFAKITNNTFTSIALFDPTGRKINSQFSIEENEIRVTPAKNIIPGIYIFELITKDAVYDFKVLKMGS